ncbi:MAG: helicase C-terminal domain-containing protein [Cyanobacteria bacterium J06642_2]
MPNASDDLHVWVSGVIEVEVHQQLRQLQRQQTCGHFAARARSPWPHQLTMARLVARGLRLQRHALIQVPPGGDHRLSYLLPALMWPGPTLICAPAEVRAELLHDLLPFLQAALKLSKPARECDRPLPDFDGVMLLDPLKWLCDRLHAGWPRALVSIPLIVDGAECLEGWAQQALTVSLTGQHWHQLRLALPQHADIIQRVEIQLFQMFSRRPLRRFALHSDEQAMLMSLEELLARELSPLPTPWGAWLQQRSQPDPVGWVDRNLETGQFMLHVAPADAAEVLTEVWSSQPVVIVGEALGATKTASHFRQRLGLPDATTLQFLPDRRDEAIHICVPAAMPVPHSQMFRDRAIAYLKHLLCEASGPTIVLVSDRPLQSQIGTVLAAEFGSRVRVNEPYCALRGICICGWDYWLQHLHQLPAPTLISVVTLPFPSMEEPLVAGRVEHLKGRRQDWFRSYLLPVAISTLQRAIGPLRRTNGTLVLLDSRTVSRSYGEQFLDALNPALSVTETSLLKLMVSADCPEESWSVPTSEFPNT